MYGHQNEDPLDKQETKGEEGSPVVPTQEMIQPSDHQSKARGDEAKEGEDRGNRNQRQTSWVLRDRLHCFERRA